MRLFCAAVASIACLAACGGQSGDSQQAQVSQYQAVSVDGAPVSLAALRGEAVLLNVWATWCAPCRQEVPFLAALQTRLGELVGRGAEVSIGSDISTELGSAVDDVVVQLEALSQAVDEVNTTGRSRGFDQGPGTAAPAT